MSAPDRSLKKQKKRHWGSLLGIALAIAVAIGLLLWWLSSELAVEQPAEEEAAPAVTDQNGIPAEGSATETPDGAAPQVIED